jgi:5'(3')-deoxyribonucleotidase
VRRLAEVHDVVFVTSPHMAIPEWTWARQRWLEKRFPGLAVIHTKHKNLIRGDAIIDDKFENVKTWIHSAASAGWTWGSSAQE